MRRALQTKAILAQASEDSGQGLAGRGIFDTTCMIMVPHYVCMFWDRIMVDQFSSQSRDLMQSKTDAKMR